MATEAPSAAAATAAATATTEAATVPPATATAAEDASTKAATAAAATTAAATTALEDVKPLYKVMSKRVPKRYFPFCLEHEYPAHVAVDFNRISAKSLERYVDEFGVKVDPDASTATLAASVARHFSVHDQDTAINEMSIVRDCLRRSRQLGYAPGPPMAGGGAGGAAGAGMGGGAGGMTQPKPKKRRRRTGAAIIPQGTVVCAKVKDQFILGKTVSYSGKGRRYEIEDVDADVDAIHTVPQAFVLPLSPPSAQFEKGQSVLSLFPHTTSFYPGTVVTPVRNGCVGIRFDDDYEEGRLIKKRAVPVSYVIAFSADKAGKKR